MCAVLGEQHSFAPNPRSFLPNPTNALFDNNNNKSIW